MTTTNCLPENVTGPFAYYARKSDSKSDLGRQVQNIDAACRESGIVIPSNLRYEDTGSRDRSKKRERFQQMLRDAEAGRFRTLLVTNLDRFGIEDAFECIAYVRRLQECRVTLYSLEPGEGDLTAKDQQNLIKLIFKAEGSREEQIKKGGRAITGKIRRLNVGASFQGGPCPYGYDKRCESPTGEHLWTIHHEGPMLRLLIGPDGVARRCDGDKTTHPIKRTADKITLVPSRDVERVKAVKLMFDLWANHDLPILGVCKKLNQMGFRHYGDFWKPTAVRGMLSNPVYTGTLTFNRRKWGRFVSSTKDGREVKHETDEAKRKKFFRPEAEWVERPDAHDALIEPGVYRKAQAKLDALKKTTSRPPRHPDLWLRRFCVCHHCGQPMQARHVGGIPYLICGRRKKEASIGAPPTCQFNSVRHERVEKIVADEFGELVDRTASYEGEQLLALFQKFQPRMLELTKWHVDVVEFLTAKIGERFGIRFDATDYREKLERMTGKYVWDDDDLPDWRKSMAAIRRAATDNPKIGGFIDQIAETWDAEVQADLDALKSKHEQATEKWAVASREQALVLKRVCDNLEAQMAELRAKLIRRNIVEMQAIVAEAQGIVAQVVGVEKVLRTGNGHAKAEALKQLVKEIRLEFAPKTSHKAKSRLILWKFMLCDGNELRATGCTGTSTGRRVRAG